MLSNSPPGRPHAGRRRRLSPPSPSCRWPWASAPTPRSSRSSTACCCGRCRCPTPGRWSTWRRRGPSRARTRATRRATASGCSATRCSATSSGCRRSFTGLAAHCLMGVNLAARGQTHERRRRGWCRAATSRRSGCSRRLGRLLTPDDDRTPGAHPRGRPQPRLLVVALRRESRRRRRAAHRQRHLDDRHRRRRRAGSRARPWARGPTCSCRCRCARCCCPGGRASTTAAATGPTCSRRLKPGVSIEQARAAMDVPYRAIITDVEAPLQTGTERPDDAALPGQAADRRARRARAERGARRSPGAAPAAAGRDRAGPGHGLRQHRQPAAGARRRAHRRDGGAAVDWRQPLAGAGPAAGRVVHAGAARRRSPGCWCRAGR